jgi:hypothetical protein
MTTAIETSASFLTRAEWLDVAAAEMEAAEAAFDAGEWATARAALGRSRTARANATPTSVVEGVAPVSANLPAPVGKPSPPTCQCADLACANLFHETRPARYFNAEDLAETLEEHDPDDPCHLDVAAPGEPVRYLCVAGRDRTDAEVEYSWMTTSRDIFLEWAAVGMVCPDCLEWLRA